MQLSTFHRAALFFLLLFCLPAISQPIIDFRVSEEPETPKFLQSDAALHILSDDQVIVAWLDDRRGGKVFYAQRFDFSGNTIISNFPILGNEQILALENNRYIVVHHYTEYPAIATLEPERVGYYQFYTGTNPVTARREIDRFTWPWCGTGFYGVGSALARLSRNILYVNNWGGRVSFKSMTLTGEIEFASDPWMPLTDRATEIAVASDTANQRFAIFYHAIRDWRDEPEGIFGHIYDETYAPLDTVSVAVDTSSQYSSGYRLSAMVLARGLFQLFWANGDSLAWAQISSGGEILHRGAMTFPRPAGWESVESFRAYLTNFARSNIRNGKFYLWLRVSQSGRLRGQYVHRETQFVQAFSATGERLGDLLEPDLPAFLHYQTVFQSFFIDTDGWARAPLIESDDLYLVTLQNFQETARFKIHDDPPGANQSAPIIFGEPNGSFLASWAEPNGRWVRYLDGNGHLLTARRKMPLGNGKLFPRAKHFLTTWFVEKSPGIYNGGVAIYETEGWTVVAQDTIFHNAGYPQNLLDIAPLDSMKYVVAYFLSSAAEVHLAIRSINGKLQYEQIIAGYPPIKNVNLYPLDDQRFWLRLDDDYRLFDPQQQILGAKHHLPFRGYFMPLDGWRFLMRIYDPGAYLMTVVDTAFQQLLLPQPLTALNPQGQSNFVRLSPERILTWWRQGDSLYAQTFDDHFQIVRTAFVPHSKTPQKLGESTVTTAGPNVVFAWSAIRDGTTGRDIFASIYPRRLLISSVKTLPMDKALSGYTLSQSYPNPFHAATASGLPATTMIRYSLPAAQHVVIKLYDMLGREIRTVVDATQTAGEHTVPLALFSLASGSYFYRIEAGGFSQTRKLVITR